MALFLVRRRSRPPQPPRVVVLQPGSDRCPQPHCRHPSHLGVPVPTRYCGSSRLLGRTIHHVRCVLNPLHHQQFTKVCGLWRRICT
jgi:hypothetical protein